MRIKYETPELEIVKFTLATNVLTASVSTDTPEQGDDDVVIPGNTGIPFPGLSPRSRIAIPVLRPQALTLWKRPSGSVS